MSAGLLSYQRIIQRRRLLGTLTACICINPQISRTCSAARPCLSISGCMHTANYSARKRNCGWRTRVLPPLPAPRSRKDPEGSQHACRLGKANGRGSVTFTLPVALYWIVNDTPSCVPSVITLRYLSYCATFLFYECTRTRKNFVHISRILGDG